MKPIYKTIKLAVPHCSICRERLCGNNSIISPYWCKCGAWEWRDGEYHLKPANN